MAVLLAVSLSQQHAALAAIRSPLLWNFFAILTYVSTSMIFWHFGLLPDLATLRDRATTRGKQVAYGAMAIAGRSMLLPEPAI
jgi:hypothetical protein